jgi:threonine/homoserine/homoserine lactone efflux protein
MDWPDAFRVLLKGLALGFSIAAPVGPIGVLVIRRTISHGFKSGLASGLGAASADALYGTVAAAGLTLVADFLVQQSLWMGLLGGAFLTFLGLRIFFSRPPQTESPQPHNSAGGDYLSTFFLTLSNPMTIIAFVAILGGLGAVDSGAFRLGAFLIVLGVFSGSALWWLLLSALVGLLRARLTSQALLWVNRAAGLVILAFSGAILWRLFFT